MQQVVQYQICDRHLALDDVEVPGEPTPPITLGKAKARVIDLCPECRELVYEPLAALLEDGRSENGTRPRRKRPQPAQQPAERAQSNGSANGKAKTSAKHVELEAHICPTCSQQFKNAAGLGAHRSRKHGYRAGDDDK